MKLTQSQKDAMQEMILRWVRSPLAFCREALQANPEPWQAKVLQDVEDGAKRIAIRAGHGVGKTALEAWLIWWFLFCRRPCKIPVTANSQDQLRDVVWSELAKWRDKMPDFLKAALELETERAYVKACPNEAFAVARTARPEKPEALQGFHSDFLFFVIEEASGIEDVIFETAGGALTSPHSLVLMCGNPTRTSGYFYRAFHGSRDGWRCHHVPCSASSRVSPAYAAEIAREYGESSNVYRVRVLGEFPTSEDDAVIALGLIESATGREVAISERQVVWGLDVARFGDDWTALCKRRGNTVLQPTKAWSKKDLMQTAGIIYQEWRETPLEDRPAAINVDVIGLGAGVVDRLKELGLPVRGINVGEASATDSARYMRLRDELWFAAREWLAEKAVRLPVDEALAAQLVGPKYKITSGGKLQVESKDDMKKRGVRSPDRADAFCLTFAGGDYKVPSVAYAETSYDPFKPFTERDQRQDEYRPW